MLTYNCFLTSNKSYMILAFGIILNPCVYSVALHCPINTFRSINHTFDWLIRYVYSTDEVICLCKTHASTQLYPYHTYSFLQSHIHLLFVLQTKYEIILYALRMSRKFYLSHVLERLFLY